MNIDGNNLTQWLRNHPEANGYTDQIFETLYAELRHIAGAHMRRENAGHTLSATSLLHEAWFRMDAQTTPWQNRAHFLATASTMMRRILVSHAVAKHAEKRAVEFDTLTLSGLSDLGANDDKKTVAVHDALLELAELDARSAKVVELRYFGGLNNAEIAEVLSVSVPTVKRDWDIARAWLRRALSA